MGICVYFFVRSFLLIRFRKKLFWRQLTVNRFSSKVKTFEILNSDISKYIFYISCTYLRTNGVWYQTFFWEFFFLKVYLYLNDKFKCISKIDRSYFGSYKNTVIQKNQFKKKIYFPKWNFLKYIFAIDVLFYDKNDGGIQF